MPSPHPRQRKDGDGWKPFSTAPKTGQVLDVWVRDGDGVGTLVGPTYFLGFKVSDGNDPKADRTHRFHLVRGVKWDSTHKCWVSAGNPHYVAEVDLSGATHWRPIPPPPDMEDPAFPGERLVFTPRSYAKHYEGWI